MSMGDCLSRLDTLKLVTIRLDCTKWNTWKIEIVRAFRLQQVAHYIGMDDHRMCL